MVDRAHIDGTLPRLAPLPARSEFGIKPAPTLVELPTIAINASLETQPNSAEANGGNHALIGEIWMDLDRIQRNERRQKELDEIQLRLLGHREIAEHLWSSSGPTPVVDGGKSVEDNIASVMEYDLFEAQRLVGQDNAEQRAAEAVSETDREKVLARIELALKNVLKLRSELTFDTGIVYDRLLSLSTSINDLNLARSRVDDAHFGLYSASDAVDAVMIHVRAAIVAHGKMSPELVRLVLS